MKILRRLKIAIVGAGTAGPAAARFLARQGHEVALFEKAPEPSPVGAGITLQPTGLSVLKQLGLLSEVLASGSRIDRLDGRTKSGRGVLDLEYARLHPGYFGLGIHRGSLFQTLFAGLEDLGILVCAGTEVLSYEERPRQVALKTAEFEESYDLLVVADGARSSLREHHVLPFSVRKYDWGALWAVVPMPPGTEEGRAHTLSQVFDGTRRFVGFLPSGTGPRGSEFLGKPIVSLFWSARSDQMGEIRDKGVESFRSEVRALIARSHLGTAFRDWGEGVLSGLGSSEQLLPASYYDVVMPRPCSERVVFLGDAAHAMSPQLGQGANLALYDAWTLSEALLASGGDVPRALADYRDERASHLRFYQWATRLLTPLFQSDWPVLGAVRDITMGPLCRLPFFGVQGLGAMAGFKTGVFTGVPVSRRLGSRPRG